MTANPPPVPESAPSIPESAELPPAGLPEKFRPLAAELRVYYRELPQLLADGESGKYFVAKGETSHGVWDTFRDARQYGYAVFPDGVFLTQQIDARFLNILAAWFGPYPEPDEGV